VGLRAGQFLTTARAGDEAVLTRRAIEDGATTIVAVGGDGTWSNVASALIRSGAGCRLGLIAAGTGNDFAKSVGAPARDCVASARLAVDGPDSRVDVGRAEDQYFLNAIGFGFDVAVLEEAARVRWLRGAALYAYAALRQLFRYAGIDVAFDAERTTRRLIFVVANGRWFGGAFQIAPGAAFDDGLLDVVAIPEATGVERLRLLASALRGAHVRLPTVEVRRSRAFTLRFETPPAYDLDGEHRRARSNVIQIECVPGALRVVGASVRGTTVAGR
jgi:diacylglycerol kinase (ATP)